MDTIELRGLTFYGYHGALPEEQTLGQRFVIDIQLRLSLLAAGRQDDLTRTVHYGHVAETVRQIVEGARFHLIEALAESLAAAILGTYDLAEQVDVRVEKPSAPVAVAASGLIAVSISRRRGEAGADQDPPAVVRAPDETPAPGGAVAGGPGVMVRAGRSMASGGAAPATGAAALTDGGIPVVGGGSVLAEPGIRALLTREPPLLAPLDDPEAQIQPNGVDLTLESVWTMAGVGAIGRSNAERVIPAREPIEPSADGWYTLRPGAYVIRLREVVALPLDVMAFGRPRSSLLRCGTALHTAVWDAGYRGRSEALLVVYAEDGVRLARGARVLQLVFLRLDEPTHGYSGTYQGEHISAPVRGGAC